MHYKQDNQCILTFEVEDEHFLSFWHLGRLFLSEGTSAENVFVTILDDVYIHFVRITVTYYCRNCLTQELHGSLLMIDGSFGHEHSFNNIGHIHT